MNGKGKEWRSQKIPFEKVLLSHFSYATTIETPIERGRRREVGRESFARREWNFLKSCIIHLEQRERVELIPTCHRESVSTVIFIASFSTFYCMFTFTEQTVSSPFLSVNWFFVVEISIKCHRNPSKNEREFCIKLQSCFPS